MAPTPHRGTRNTSANLPYVVNALAEIKGILPEQVIEIQNKMPEGFTGWTSKRSDEALTAEIHREADHKSEGADRNAEQIRENGAAWENTA